MKKIFAIIYVAAFALLLTLGVGFTYKAYTVTADTNDIIGADTPPPVENPIIGEDPVLYLTPTPVTKSDAAAGTNPAAAAGAKSGTQPKTSSQSKTTGTTGATGGGASGLTKGMTVGNLSTAKLGDFTFTKVPFGSFKDFFVKLSLWMLGALVFWAVINIVYAGILYITAGQNTEQTEKAKKTITGVITGLVVGTCALLIVYTVIQVFTGNFNSASTFSINPTPTPSPSVSPGSVSTSPIPSPSISSAASSVGKPSPLIQVIQSPTPTPINAVFPAM
jgi:hypothetical protein